MKNIRVVRKMRSAMKANAATLVSSCYESLTMVKHMKIFVTDMLMIRVNSLNKYLYSLMRSL